MSHPVLVLVDPDENRRQLFGAALQRHFELYAFANADLAASAAITMRAAVVIAHMEQSHGDGSDLCRDLRRSMRARPCLLVVHGRSARASSESGVLSVVVDHGADLLLAQDVAPAFLLRAVARRLKGFELREDLGPIEFVSAQRPAAGPAAPRGLRLPTAVEVQVFFHRIDGQLSWPRIREALVRPRTPLIEVLPPADEITWRQALTGRASARNIGVVLGKPVTPLVRRLPVDRKPSWKEVLRAEVNAHNLRVLLGGQRLAQAA